MGDFLNSEFDHLLDEHMSNELEISELRMQIANLTKQNRAQAQQIKHLENERKMRPTQSINVNPPLESRCPEPINEKDILASIAFSKALGMVSLLRKETEVLWEDSRKICETLDGVNGEIC